MSVNPKRLRALPLAVLVAAAVPLAVPVAANAAMGGGNALTTTLRPDLRNATVQSTNAVDDSTTVRVCFNKAIASLPLAAHFWLGTYRDDDPGDRLQASSAVRSSANCADAVFPDDDAKQFTFLGVDGSDGSTPFSGFSAVATNGFGNIQDSTALIGSSTHNGTRGFSTGPDLVGIAINNAAATVDYTFDQRVSAALGTDGALAATWVVNNQDGTEVNSLPGAGNRSLSADGLTVRVKFPVGSVAGAVRAFVREDAVNSKANIAAGGAQPNGLRSAARPGSGGFTDLPDLVNTTLAADGTYVDFQYDQVITAISATLGDWVVGGSAADFDFSPAAAADVTADPGSNTVRVKLTNSSTFNEFLVEAASEEGAVTGATGPSTAGGLPIGGNIGAFATGFTVGPEALGTTFDNATDTVTVRFDQRWQDDTEAFFKLIDDQGSQVAPGAINVSGAGNPDPGQSIATVTFPPGTVTGARSLLIQSNGVETTSPGFFSSQTQVISPTAAAAKKGMKFRAMKRR